MTDRGSTPPASVRRTRRVPDMILAAAHRACDEGMLELAGQLLWLCEQAIAVEAEPRRRRQDLWGLTAAHERLWHLRHEPADAAEATTHGPLPVSFGMAMGGK